MLTGTGMQCQFYEDLRRAEGVFDGVGLGPGVGVEKEVVYSITSLGGWRRAWRLCMVLLFA
jgi:hypothetical protein